MQMALKNKDHFFEIYLETCCRFIQTYLLDAFLNF